MKKFRSAAAFLLVLMLVFSSAMPAFAKDLEPCYHCGSTGQFHCPQCDNKVNITCDGCNGAGGSKCSGEEGKGPCDNGYYVCPSCHGDTYIRSGDGEIPKDAVPGSCGTCGGKGKLECWHCHGAAWIVCDRCSGTGNVECQNENCRESRKIGWKCHYCMGAGYLLTNFWPGENDGVQNKPVKGDKIWVNGKSTTYGESGSGNGSGGGNNSQGGNSGNSGSTTPRYDGNGSNIARDPSNGRDFIWFVDTGSGKWEFGGRTFTLTRGGKTVSGIVDLKFNEDIHIDPDTGGLESLGGIHAYLTGSGGFKAELERSGDGGIAVGRHTPSGQYIPFNVSLVLEYNAAEDVSLYTIDLAGGHWDVGGTDVTATISGQPAAGVVRISQQEPIMFHGIDRDTMRVCLRGNNDFRVELELSGSDEVTIGRYSPAEAVLPPEGLYISIEHAGATGPGGEDPVHSVDFASGSWNIDGKDVAAFIGGLRAEGIRELTENDNIKLSGFDRDTMRVRVYADDGFSVGLEVNGDNEARLGLYNDPEAVLPPELHFVIEQREDISDGDRTFEVDFGSGSWTFEGVGRPVVAWINGRTVSGVVQVKGFENIMLEDFDGGFMQVRVYADDGFSAILEHSGDNEVSLERLRDPGLVLPDSLHFVVERTGEEPQPEEKRYSLITSSYIASVYPDPAVKNYRSIYKTMQFDLKFFGSTVYLDAFVRDPNATKIWYGNLVHRPANIYSVNEDTEIQIHVNFPNTAVFFNKYCKVFVLTYDGRYVELIPDENGRVKLSRRTPSDAVLTENLAICFKTVPVKGLIWYDSSLSDVPIQSLDNIIIDGIDNGSPISSFDIRAAAMTKEEQAAYLALSDEEKDDIAKTLETVVRSVKVASMNDALKRKLRKIAKENGFDKVKNANNVLLIDDAQFIPIQFDGHIELDFPVVVEIAVEPGFVRTDKTMFLYHINYKGEVEFLEHGVKKDENGNVIAITFHTRSFSDFFLSDVKLSKGLGEEDLDYFYEHLGAKKPFPTATVIASAAAVVAAAAAVIIVKRKKEKEG